MDAASRCTGQARVLQEHGEVAAKAAKRLAAHKAPPKTARTASKARQRSAGKGDLRQLSKAELYQRATEQGIEGRSKMSREQLVDALTRAGRRRKKSAA